MHQRARGAFFLPFMRFFVIYIEFFAVIVFTFSLFSPPFPVLYYDKVIPHSESGGGIAIKVKLSLPSL